MNDAIDKYRHPLNGATISAKYNICTEPLHKNNPLIETLPKMYSKEEIFTAIARYPVYAESERENSAIERLDALNRLNYFVFPMPFHFDLALKFHRILRQSYVPRNPFAREFKKTLKHLFKNYEEIRSVTRQELHLPLKANALVLLGTSGIGKTLALDMILQLYPQVIIHKSYHGQPFIQKQLVWLKVECPSSCSPKVFCIHLLKAIDTALCTDENKKFYAGSRGFTTTQLINAILDMIYKKAFIGVIAIDEIQRLRIVADAEGKELIAFFEYIADIGIGLILCGTFRAIKLFKAEFAELRRNSSVGDMLLTNMAKDEYWDIFISKLWEYQWTKNRIELTPELNKAIYDESQGILDIAVKLYCLAQVNAIGGREKISKKHIIDTSKKEFNFMRPVLQALRHKRYDLLESMDDIGPPQNMLDSSISNALFKSTIYGLGNTTNNKEAKTPESSNKPETNPVVTIATILTKTGVDTKIAYECAVEAIKHHGDKASLMMATIEAFNLVSRKDQLASSGEAKLLADQDFKDADPREVCGNGKLQRESAVSALTDAGMIFDMKT